MLQGKDKLLAETEGQLTALGMELKEKYEYLHSIAEEDGDASQPKSPVKIKGAENLVKEKEAILQKLSDITDKSKSDRKSMASKDSKSFEEAISPRRKGRPKKATVCLLILNFTAKCVDDRLST